jgi:acyl-CoA hydrolase
MSTRIRESRRISNFKKPKEKTPSESGTIMTHVVLPNEVNPLGILMGGVMLNWMDLASAICAQRHANSTAVTAAVNQVVFNHPVYVGEIVEIRAHVSRSFHSSMDVYVEVWVENISLGVSRKTHEAVFTLVALGSDNKPMKTPAVKPESALERKRFDDALLRRERREKTA